MRGPRTILDTNALVLVSGDGDLQALDPFEGIRILSPAAFLERLSER